jgi:hypothetical protein
MGSAGFDELKSRFLSNQLSPFVVAQLNDQGFRLPNQATA